MIWTWIKKFGLKEGIKELDLLKPFVAGKLSDAQNKFGSIPPEQFADVLVTEIQMALCGRLGVAPEDVGLGDKK